jgi:hypothetical protein
MFLLRSVKTTTKASIASRIVAGIPKVTSPSIQRAFFSKGASRKQQVAPKEPTGGSEIIKNIESRTAGVSDELSRVSPTLKKFQLDGKVAVVTG